ncbi:MAG: MFS transporter [Thermoleophilia bacterium]|nr:MFS transporter [Thermoleophilia bacterium]
MSRTPSPKLPGPSYRWAILVMALLIVFGALGLSRFAYTSILPPMQEALGLTNAQAGGLATANLVGYLVLGVFTGALAARIGPRRVIVAGCLVMALGMFITGISNSYLPALAGRVLSGFGAAGSNIPANTIIAMWFSRRRRGVATGFVSTGASLGLVVAGPLVPWIMSLYPVAGWRVSWYVLASITFLVAVAGALVLRDRPGYEPEGVESEISHGKVEWRQLYFSGRVWRLGACYFCFGFSYIIYLTFFAKRLIADIGYTQSEAGILFMILGWASLPCGLIWGWIADRIGRRAAMAVALALQAVAEAIFALWTEPAGLTTSAVIWGLTAWSMPMLMAVTSGDIVGPVMAPAAYGFLTIFHGIGQATGPYVAGVMADHLPSFRASYLMAAGVALLGALGLSLLPRGATGYLGQVEPHPVTDHSRLP